VRPLVSASQAAAIDANVKIRCGLGDDLLMESAAGKLYEALKGLAPWAAVQAGAALVAVCGKGNNAGDALAMVRKAAFEGLREVSAVVPSDLNATAGRRLQEARKAGVRILDLDSPEAEAAVLGAAILLDGITGTGIKGCLRAPFDRLAAMVSSAGGSVVAIDVPSGLCRGSAPGAVVVKADYTLSIAPAKLELYIPGLRGYAGAILEVDGVFPSDCAQDSGALVLSAEDLPALIPALASDAYKGSRGALGIYAGAVGTTGAAVLSARSASASGAGTVTLLCRDEVWQVLASSLSSQMVRPLSSGPGREFSAVLAGPGWGMDGVSSAILDRLLASGTALVLDADALRLLGSASLPARRESLAPMVLTPHPGEFTSLALRVRGNGPGGSIPDPAVLAGIQEELLFDTPAILRESAAFFNAVVILKNHVSWIAAPDGRLAVWDGREPALGTGGSGDVLAGLAAGLLARGVAAFEAACAAVVAHGLAGKAAAEDLGYFDASVLPAYAARILYRRSNHGNKG